MMRYPYALALSACLLIFLPVLALGGMYFEDFTTLDYCDSTSTTALWDTTAGELKLPGFSITQVGRYPVTTYPVLGVAVSGDYAYVTNIDRFVVVDVTDPSDPTFVGSCSGLHFARAVAVSGNYAYIADGAAGLKVIGIHYPASPMVVGSYVDNGAVDVEVDGDHAYLSSTSDGVVIVDITLPLHPVYEGGWDSPGSVYGVAISGDRAYVADNNAGLQVLDISDPSSPTFVGGLDTPYQARGVAVSGDHAYVADGSGLVIVDISTPSSPTLEANCATPGSAVGVVLEGNYAYVSDGNLGLSVIDITDPSNPVLAQSYDTPDRANSTVIAGEHAYVADADSGLVVLDIADPAVPPLLAGTQGLADMGIDIDVAGDYAYVVRLDAVLSVMSISDPAVPIEVGSCSTVPYPLSIAVSGDYAFVGAYDRLATYDISDPTNPTYAGSEGVMDEIGDVTISGNYAYCALENGTLLVVDISDPASPSIEAWLAIRGPARSIAVSGNYAFVAVDYTCPDCGGFDVIDIYDPSSPYLAGRWEADFGSTGLAVSGDYAYISQGMEINVVDIHDVENPSEIGSCYATGYRLAVSGNYLYGCGAGLAVVDVTDPTDPVRVANIVHPGENETRSIAIAGDHVFLPSREYLYVYEVFQRRYGLDADEATSLTVAPGEDVSRVRLWPPPTVNGTIHWSVWSDSLAGWHSVSPGSLWTYVHNSGSGLRWHSSLTYDQAGLNPTCSELWIEYENALSGTPDPEKSDRFSLSVPSPSPFSTVTRVSFALPRPEMVRLTVHDVLGRVVTVLAEGRFEAGEFSEMWDGRNAAGDEVGPGVYYVRLNTGSFIGKEEVILLR